MLLLSMKGFQVSYDVIGDIHGQAGKLEALLTELGYVRKAGGWFRMYPCTPLHGKQVQDSRRTNPDSTLSMVCANVLMSNRNAAGLRRLIEENDLDLIFTAETDAWW